MQLIANIVVQGYTRKRIQRHFRIHCRLTVLVYRITNARPLKGRSGLRMQEVTNSLLFKNAVFRKYDYSQDSRFEVIFEEHSR